MALTGINDVKHIKRRMLELRGQEIPDSLKTEAELAEIERRNFEKAYAEAMANQVYYPF